tara:strand:- start:140 stop:364 length:225 start_codon:yes stop_codon:yes gene_type:complete
LDETDKTEATRLLSELGLNFNQAINIFVKQLIKHQGLPFDVRLPNQDTIDAMNEGRSNQQGFDSANKMLKEILG